MFWDGGGAHCHTSCLLRNEVKEKVYMLTGQFSIKFTFDINKVLLNLNSMYQKKLPKLLLGMVLFEKIINVAKLVTLVGLEV